MANIIVLGAGIGGMSAAYELRAAIGPAHTVTVVGEGGLFSFTPSNPWVAVGWRKPGDIQVDVAGHLAAKSIAFEAAGAETVLPKENTLVLRDGRRLAYDYLVVTTGPRLAFDEVPGLGPGGAPTAGLHQRPCGAGLGRYPVFLRRSGSGGRGRGARCKLLWPGLRVRDDPRRRPAQTQVA